ncbi:casbene synthase, chloroplastic-like isoform X2 [Ricinus communis]|uniref:Casbene synthase, chloroplastic n=1 Tax=Ricinus communis TaxID=3988 RepID=CASS_RICCO|nr:casbene synthase, chloroplastic [Ricinus communis]P59287.1 RecName: Full=Casbene synthase, chloroplastic; Flags: Precursor [Ricinus communis]EEF48743.1 Casbene synthase, chloroplast precursor [Ricinus communis]|eukprot:XP_002513340.1 casbene synthase, chloroplastic [Ricinus communis]
MALPSAAMQSNPEKLNLFHRLSSLPTTSLEYGNNRFPFFSSSAKSHFKKPTQACLSSTTHQEVRPLAYFPPTVWGNRFASLTFNPSEFESYDERVIVLKKKVKDILISSTSDSVETVILIDLLCRLGVSYHFENDIEELLSKIFNSQPDLVDEKECDLYTAAIVFRVFRQHGFKMSSDVFSKFKDSDGKFKESLRGDAKGMLSLFEASHLSVHGEDILEEAFAFTKDYLQSSAVELFPNLKRHITNALEQPFHSGVPRLEARKFIDLYEADIECRNETLLEFAKLDYNRVQLLHQQELCQFSKWWKDLNLASDIPYARDRMAEIFFWAVAMYFEPDYAHTRMIIAKVVLLISLIDDTIDAYATMEETHILAEAVARWDMSCLEKLPDYMKVIYKLLLNTFSEFEKELTAEGKSYSVKYGREAFQELVRGYYLEAVWRDEGKIPSFDDYLYNGSMTTGLPLVSTASFMGVQEITGLNEFQWLETNPKLSYASGAFIRLVNDLTSHVTEQQRGHVASCIDCYMNQHGVSKDEAVKILQKMATDCWKEINEECMRQSQVSVGHLMRIVNLARLTDVSYKYGDGYTDSQQLKQFVKGLFVDPISI